MTGPNERDEIAWMVHRASGCGPMVGLDNKPGPICEPDREDWAAADALLDWLAERDRRTAAKTLREAASKPIPDGFMNVKRWLRETAARIEVGR